MPASRALSALAEASPAPERAPHPILASIMPALDTAYGLESSELFPDEIAALVVRLTVALDLAEIASEVVYLEAA